MHQRLAPWCTHSPGSAGRRAARGGCSQPGDRLEMAAWGIDAAARWAQMVDVAPGRERPDKDPVGEAMRAHALPEAVAAGIEATVPKPASRHRLVELLRVSFSTVQRKARAQDCQYRRAHCARRSAYLPRSLTMSTVPLGEE